MKYITLVFCLTFCTGYTYHDVRESNEYTQYRCEMITTFVEHNRDLLLEDITDLAMNKISVRKGNNEFIFGLNLDTMDVYMTGDTENVPPGIEDAFTLYKDAVDSVIKEYAKTIWQLDDIDFVKEEMNGGCDLGGMDRYNNETIVDGE